jgi:copper chaperone NosL
MTVGVSDMGFKTRVVAALLVGLLVTACDKVQESSFSEAPVAFHPNDECHVCAHGDQPIPRA